MADGSDFTLVQDVGLSKTATVTQGTYFAVTAYGPPGINFDFVQQPLPPGETFGGYIVHYAIQGGTDNAIDVGNVPSYSILNLNPGSYTVSAKEYDSTRTSLIDVMGATTLVLNTIESVFSNIVGTAQASTFTFGETSILPTDDFGNAGLILAQQATLSQPVTIQSLSFYVTSAAGNMRLGVYSDSSGSPGSKVAETAEFTPVVGWNTQPVISQANLAAGTYWLAYETNNNSLHFRNTNQGTIKLVSQTYGILPATYPGGLTTQTYHWSFYATMAAQGGSPPPALTSATIVPN